VTTSRFEDSSDDRTLAIETCPLACVAMRNMSISDERRTMDDVS
jgi:hypothetical protein